jgi:hypothetical protein
MPRRSTWPFTRDGRLAVACGLAVPIFDTDTGRESSRLRHPDKAKQVSSVAWQPLRRPAAGHRRGRKIYLWDTETAAEVMPPGRPRGMVTWLDSTTPATAWWVTTACPRCGTRPAAVAPDLGRIHPSAVQPRRLPARLVAPRTEVALWRVAAGRELHVLRRRSAASDEQISGPVIHADGRASSWPCSDDYLRMTFFDLLRGEVASVALPEGGNGSPEQFRLPGGLLGNLRGRRPAAQPASGPSRRCGSGSARRRAGCRPGDGGKLG